MKLAELFAASEKKTYHEKQCQSWRVEKTDAGFDYISIARGEDTKILSAKMLGAKATALMNVIRAGYDVVIVNADSLDKSADAISFAKYSDEEILVATTDRTKNAELREAVASLAQVKAKEVNVVLFETK